MSNKKFAVSLVALLVAGVAGSAFAGEVPASFDPSKCKVEYPKASLMNEEQGVDLDVVPGQSPTARWPIRSWKNRAASRAWTRPR